MKYETWEAGSGVEQNVSLETIVGFAVCILLLAILGGCVAPLPLQYGLSPIRIEGRLSEEIRFQGVSFFAPAGDHWFVMKNPCPVSPVVQVFGFFAKQPPVQPTFDSKLPAGQSFHAMVTLLDSQGQKFSSATALRDALDRSLTTASRKLEFRIKSERPMCIDYNHTGKVANVPQAPGQTFTLDIRGAICIHPLNPTYLVEVIYSHRYPADVQPIPVSEEVKPLFDRIRFDTYPNPPPNPLLLPGPLRDAVCEASIAPPTIYAPEHLIGR